MVKNSIKSDQEHNSPGRSRRDIEDSSEFLIKKLELRNLVDGLQILINEHLLMVSVLISFLIPIAYHSTTEYSDVIMYISTIIRITTQ